MSRNQHIPQEPVLLSGLPCLAAEKRRQSDS